MYPDCLHDLGDKKPDNLRGIGDPVCLSLPSISIIGSRRATPYGLACAAAAGRIAAECGVVVVSGGACGCDFAASRACLDRGGKTVIVAGTGADRYYPSSSYSIFKDAWEGRGCVISPHRWNMGPNRWVFPKRNPIIAALSRDLLVVEAAIKSGTLSTVEAAESIGRRVYCIPGSIFSNTSKGCNCLISHGAGIIADELALEIQLALDYDVTRVITDMSLKDQGRVMSCLLAGPMYIEDIAACLGVDVMCVIDTLQDYQYQGIVTLMSNGKYTLTQKGYLSFI